MEAERRVSTNPIHRSYHAAVLCAVLAGLAVSFTGVGAAAPAAAAGCSPAEKATNLRIQRVAGARTATLRWRSPRRLPAGFGSYRVLRNGRVLGQTRGRSLRVRVSPGRTYAFAVRTVLRNGRVSSCGASRRLAVPFVLPGAPRNVAVQATAEGAVVRWERAKRGDAPIVGYRVFRDGTLLRQTKATSLEIALPSLRSFKFRVVAVDRTGRLSAASATVTVQTGHVGPSVPQNLTAEVASDSQVRLSWSPSAGKGGVKISYRVYRNGVTLRATPLTSLTVSGLGADSSYTFTVAAVDSKGYISAHSAPASVRTGRPEQSNGHVHAYVLASTGVSFRAFQEQYKRIGTAYFTYYDCDAAGAFEGGDRPYMTRWAQLRGIKVHARFNCQKTQTLNGLLHSAELRARTIERMASEAKAHGFDGINLDFEAGLATDRDEYSSFVRELGAALHGQGTALSIAVSAKTADVPNHPRSTFFDYDAISPHVDTVFVMTWGISWMTSKPGAMDAMPWANAVANYVAARANLGKYVLGFPLYGFDWPNGGGSSNPATPLEYDDVMALAQRVGATPVRDPELNSNTFTYTENGVRHDVWFTDAESIDARIRLARNRGVGIGLWRLGREHKAVWNHPLLQPGAW
jgi:spore germination protein YaaH